MLSDSFHAGLLILSKSAATLLFALPIGIVFYNFFDLEGEDRSFPLLYELCFVQCDMLTYNLPSDTVLTEGHTRS